MLPLKQAHCCLWSHHLRVGVTLPQRLPSRRPRRCRRWGCLPPQVTSLLVLVPKHQINLSIPRAEPDLEFEGLLKRQHTRVKYFQGSLMNAMDLERAKVSAATSLEKAPQRPTLWLSLTRVMHSSIKSHPSQRNFHQTVNVCYELEIVEPATYLSPKSLFFQNSEALWISTPLFLCNPPVLTSRGLICTCKLSGVLISSH